MDKFIFHFFDRGMASNANGVAERAGQPLPQRTVCDCIHARCPARQTQNGLPSATLWAGANPLLRNWSDNQCRNVKQTFTQRH